MGTRVFIFPFLRSQSASICNLQTSALVFRLLVCCCFCFLFALFLLLPPWSHPQNTTTTTITTTITTTTQMNNTNEQHKWTIIENDNNHNEQHKCSNTIVATQIDNIVDLHVDFNTSITISTSYPCHCQCALRSWCVWRVLVCLSDNPRDWGTAWSTNLSLNMSLTEDIPK